MPSFIASIQIGKLDVKVEYMFDEEKQETEVSFDSIPAVFPAQCCGGAERTAEDRSSSDTDFPVYHQRAGPVYQISLHRSFGGLCPSV